jgi:hypothetical protein
MKERRKWHLCELSDRKRFDLFNRNDRNDDNHLYWCVFCFGGHSALWYFKPLIDLNLGINLEPFIFTSVEIQGIVLTLLAGQILALLGMLRIYRMNLIEEVARD